MIGDFEKPVDDGVNSWDWGGRSRVKMAEIVTGSGKLIEYSYHQAEISQKQGDPRR